MKQIILFISVLMFAVSSVFAGSVAGKVTDAASGAALAGANVFVEGTSVGAATDEDGMFFFEIDDGTYTFVCSFVSYNEVRKSVTVSGKKTQVDFALKANILKTSDIIVEASRAKERETPVAFTNITADEISKGFTVQDVPHLFVNTPGIYVTSDGGSGLGDSKVYIRGFDEQRMSVMINNIEVNDPESKKVYWSNWGALPSGSQSIQVQRGAGSSLYGAGAFGGSINVLTADAPAVSSFKVNATAGMYNTYKLGFDYNTGLFADNKMSFLTRINYMTGNGWRQDTYYQGMSYYFGLSYFMNEHHTFRLVLHGAPQYHAYSYYSASAKDFARYGRDWNAHPFVADNDAGLTSREKDGTSLAEMLYFGFVDKDKGGEVIGNGNTSFDNNVFHKPQLELHYTWDINKNSYLQVNSFGTMGRGYGENISSYYRIHRNDTGHMSMSTIESSGQYQYRAHSIHNQFGAVATFNTNWMGHEFSVGAEARYWWARHYGLIINTFGNRANSDVTADNTKIYVGGQKGTFREGDIYYDNTNTKPNLSTFAHALWKLGNLSIMTDLQFSSRMYHIKEDFPSSNNRPAYEVGADGKPVLDTHGNKIYTGSYVPNQNADGGNGDGFENFTFTDDSGHVVIPTFNLVDFDKVYNFLSPKLGLNYNVNKNINVFANYSRVYNEPRVKYFFNYGQPNDALDIEISDDYEFGIGFATRGFNFKLNLYNIEFQNKAYRIEDPSKANEPGYDYKGRRYIPVGDATYRGIEFNSNITLTKNLSLGTSVSRMENAWGSNISDEAKSQLGIEKGNIEPGAPQFMMSNVISYNNGPLYVSMAARHYKDYYILPSNGYAGLEYDTQTETYAREGDVLPSWSVVDVIVGWQQNVGIFNLNASLHMNNILNEEYWQIGNKYGLLPGSERNALFNLALGF